MAKHGIYTSDIATSLSTPVTAGSGIAFVIGTAPAWTATDPAAVNTPVVCTSWEEFLEKFGWSDNWTSYTLCEFAYSQFKLYSVEPVIFCNVLSSASPTTGTEETKTVTNHKVEIPLENVPASVVVKNGSSTLTKDTDYVIYAEDGKQYIELLSTSTAYSATTLKVTPATVTPSSVTATTITNNLNAIDSCMSTIGFVPDLICAPGFSDNSGLAAAMAAKAEELNGVFRCKALIDVASSVASYSGVSAWKTTNNITDSNQILCFPMLGLDTRVFHMSTQLAGLMGQIDADNDCPYESPSNKNFKMDRLIANGVTITQTKAQADILNAAGVVTALNFLSSGWVCWGNYTAAYPSSSDVKDIFIPVSRMFDWVANTCVRTFWSRLDEPMNRRFADSVTTSLNIWLDGLASMGYVLGGRCVMLDSENPITNIMAGIIKLHIYITPPTPAQEIDFVLEYDADYVTSAFSS